MAGPSSPLRGPAWADECSSEEDLAAYKLPGSPSAALHVGSEVAGKVLFVDSQGAYVEIGDATAALLPAGSPGVEYLRAGDEVEGMHVAGSDTTSGRLLLELPCDSLSEDSADETLAESSNAQGYANASTSPEMVMTAEQPPHLTLLELPRSKAIASSAEQRAAEEEAERWRRPLPGAAVRTMKAKPSRSDFRQAVQGLLACLTPETLEPIALQLAQIPVTSVAELAAVADALLRRALTAGGNTSQSEACASLACQLQKAWPRLKSIHAEREGTSFTELLAKVCCSELWQPTLASEAQAESGSKVSKQLQIRLDHAKLLGYLVLLGELSPAVLGTVASELLLLDMKGKSGAALPGEEDVLYSCEVLSLAGSCLVSTYPELSLRVCDRLTQLCGSKRSGGSAVQPLVQTYSDASMLAMKRVLNLAKAGWPMEQELRSFVTETSCITSSLDTEHTSRSKRVGTRKKRGRLSQAASALTAPSSSVAEPAEEIVEAVLVAEELVKGPSADALAAEDEFSLRAAWAKSQSRSKKPGSKLKPAIQKPEDAPIADVAISLLQKMRKEMEHRAEAKRQQLLQARAEREAAAAAASEAGGTPVEQNKVEQAREAGEDAVLLKTSRRRWGRSKSREPQEVPAEAKNRTRWRSQSRDKLPTKNNSAAGSSEASSAAKSLTTPAGGKSARAGDSDSDSDELALELQVEAEEEMEREDREEEEGFW